MRIIALLIFLACIACHRHSDSDPAPVIPAKATFSGVINGVSYAKTQSDSGSADLDSTVVWGPNLTGTSTGDSTTWMVGLYFGGFRVNDPTGYPKNSIQIYFIKHFHNAQLTLSNGSHKMTTNQFADILSTGSKSYSPDYHTNNGMFIQWYDATGALWTSSRYERVGSSSTIPVVPNFSNALFRVDKSVPMPRDYLTCKQYVETSFQCTLYNMAGDSIPLSNGKLHGIYRN